MLPCATSILCGEPVGFALHHRGRVSRPRSSAFPPALRDSYTPKDQDRGGRIPHTPVNGRPWGVSTPQFPDLRTSIADKNSQLISRKRVKAHVASLVRRKGGAVRWTLCNRASGAGEQGDSTDKPLGAQKEPSGADRFLKTRYVCPCRTSLFRFGRLRAIPLSLCILRLPRHPQSKGCLEAGYFGSP